MYELPRANIGAEERRNFSKSFEEYCEMAPITFRFRSTVLESFSLLVDRSAIYFHVTLMLPVSVQLILVFSLNSVCFGSEHSQTIASRGVAASDQLF